MPRITAGTIVKLLIASLAVGAVMAFFGISPADVLRYAQDSFVRIIDNFSAVIGTTASYILLGAAVVVPVWFIIYLLKALGGRSSRP